MNCNETNPSGIAGILKVILTLQQNACPESCVDSCDRPVLGGGQSCLVCNTRPVMIYLCGSNTALAMPTSKDSTDETNTSSVFRIEKLEDNCATFRVLTQTTKDSNTYTATNSLCTVNLNCCCCIRCLSDTYIDCV